MEKFRLCFECFPDAYHIVSLKHNYEIRIYYIVEILVGNRVNELGEGGTWKNYI